jgi:hypothetical protein
MWTTQAQLPRFVSQQNLRKMQKSAEKMLVYKLLFQNNGFPRTRHSLWPNERYFMSLSTCQDVFFSPMPSSIRSGKLLCRFQQSLSRNLCWSSRARLSATNNSLFRHPSKFVDTNQVTCIQKAHLFGWGSSEEPNLNYVYTCKHSEGCWPVRNALVETCKNLYEDDPYPIKMNASYLDTRASNHDGCRPTVMMIHGAPGSHHDFLPIIDILAEKGIRVIAPNMPGKFLFLCPVIVVSPLACLGLLSIQHRKLSMQGAYTRLEFVSFSRKKSSSQASSLLNITKLGALQNNF